MSVESTAGDSTNRYVLRWVREGGTCNQGRQRLRSG